MSDYIFTLKAKEAWCSHCGTVSSDGRCDCTRFTEEATPDWQPFDRRAFEEIEKLRSENKALRHAWLAR